MGWPQTVWVLMAGLNIAVAIKAHGLPRTGTNSAWPTIWSATASAVLLTAGGFFAGGVRP